jgi:plastocyanin
VASTTVAAGWSSGAVAVNEFYPKQLSVKSGSKVTFRAFSPFEPHTVTFGTSTSGSEDTKLLPPSGTPTGGTYSGGIANSGIFGSGKGGPFPAGPYTLTFSTKGEYHFVCVLHPGMEGIVKVT